MQIVIDIPKEYFEAIKENKYGVHEGRIYEMIRNGILLPKGHGRLIDADYLKDVILLHNFHGNNKNIVPYQDRKGYRLRQREVDEAIINAPTIMQADFETWNGIHAQITAPKGTFEKIWNEAKEEEMDI